jgi:transposase
VEPYPNEVKEYMVERMMGRERVGIGALSRETGLGTTTLSRWREEARSVARMTDATSTTKADSPPARRPQDWTPEERLHAVIEAAGLPDDRLGPWMRERGLHAAVLLEWREAALRGLGGKAVTAADAKRIKELERDLHRKDKALAETAALLVLAGKAKALWGDEGGSTDSK